MGKLFQETGGSADDARAEADRILQMLEGFELRMSEREACFVDDCRDGRHITPKMLFWLRDIKDKYV